MANNKQQYYAPQVDAAPVEAQAIPVGQSYPQGMPGQAPPAMAPGAAYGYTAPPMQQQQSYYQPTQGPAGFVPPPMNQQASYMQPPAGGAAQPHEMIDEGNARAYLTSKGWSEGLTNFLINQMKFIPYRFFILDDSGSMAASDGKRLVGSGANTKAVRCSRWTELHDMARFHAGLSRALNAPTEFRFLNTANPITIGGPSDPSNYDVLMALFEGSPGGTTPLCRHIREVAAKIQQMEPMLRATGQRASVIIITDGEASDGDVTAALRPLQNLPCWVVIRLCTDEDNVVEYWNGVDNQLELEMDVLDDLVGESQEVYELNPWVTYGEPLHRLREFGVRMKALDLIDEATLSPEQMMAVAAMLLNVKQDDLPHPEAHFSQFVKKVNELDSNIPRIWSPATNKLRNWIEPRGLERTYGKGSCTIM